MSFLVSSFALLLTIGLTLVLGIAAGYGAVMGLLYALSRRGRAPRLTPATLAPSMGRGAAAGD